MNKGQRLTLFVIISICCHAVCLVASIQSSVVEVEAKEIEKIESALSQIETAVKSEEVLPDGAMIRGSVFSELPTLEAEWEHTYTIESTRLVYAIFVSLIIHTISFALLSKPKTDPDGIVNASASRD